MARASKQVREIDPVDLRMWELSSGALSGAKSKTWTITTHALALQAGARYLLGDCQETIFLVVACLIAATAAYVSATFDWMADRHRQIDFDMKMKYRVSPDKKHVALRREIHNNVFMWGIYLIPLVSTFLMRFSLSCPTWGNFWLDVSIAAATFILVVVLVLWVREWRFWIRLPERHR